MPPASIPVIFATSFVVGFSGAITPGPLLVYSIRESIRRGFIAGPLVATGHALLELVVVAGLAVGVAGFLETGLARFIIGVVGGVFLLWMGWGMAWKPARHTFPVARRSPSSAAGAGQPAVPVLGGALVSISNPFWSLWWATIGLGYILWARDLGVSGVISFYTGHILSDLVWYSLVAFAVASGRRFLTGGVYQVLIAVCGLFLLALGAFFIFSGAGYLKAFLEV